MFEDFLSQKLDEAAIVWSAQKNDLIESAYLGLAKQWAEAKIRGGTAPAPEIPHATHFEREGSNIIEKNTDTPISSIRPEAFLPTYKTDLNPVGSGIGGPIEGQVDKFYVTAASNPQPGEIVKQAGSTYVYQRPTPFGGFWVKL